MIQSTQNDLLRNTAGQLPATQFIQDQLRAANAANQIKPTPAADSADVSLSDTSKLLNAVDSGSTGSNPFISALNKLVEQLTGSKVSDISLSGQTLKASSFSFDATQEALKVGKSGVSYAYDSVHAEGQQLSYSAQGAITLEDGTKLNFDFKLEVSQIYVEQNSARVQIDGSRLNDTKNNAKDNAIPGMTRKERDSGVDVDLDHRGVRHLLDSMDEPRAHRSHGHHRGHGHHGRVHEKEEASTGNSTTASTQTTSSGNATAAPVQPATATQTTDQTAPVQGTSNRLLEVVA